MKSKVVLIGMMALTVSMAGRAEEKVLFSMNFDDMPPGLVGNNSGWSNPEGKVIIREIPGIGKVISSDGVKADERHDLAMYTNPEPFGIRVGSKIAVEFDLYAWF